MKLTSSVTESFNGPLWIEPIPKGSLQAASPGRKGRASAVHSVDLHLRLEIDANFCEAAAARRNGVGDHVAECAASLHA